MQYLKDILILQKREFEQTILKPYIPRTVKIPEIEKDIIKVVIGMRRAGKSFFVLHQLKNLNNTSASA